MRVVSLERPLKGHQLLYVSKFIFELKYLTRVQSSEQLHSKRSTSREKDKFKIILTDYIHYLT